MTTHRTVLVTGSSSGIGLAIARELAAAGHDVMLNGIEPPESVAAICAELSEGGGGQVDYRQADLTDGAAVRRLVAEAAQAMGQVDILVNNAGIQHVAPVEEFPPAKWDAILALNLTASFHASAVALPGMRERGWGRIVNVASAHALVASPFKSAYVAAKHGVAGLTKTVALEAAESGVTVNAICPGYELTPLVEKQIPETARGRGMTEEAVKRDVLLGAPPTREFVGSDEIAALCLFLAGEQARSITGAILPVDGGWTAQ